MDKLQPIDPNTVQAVYSIAEVEALQAQLAEARKDAARLDWLEKTINDEGHCNCLTLTHYVSDEPGVQLWGWDTKASVREAIDAARALTEAGK